MKPPKLLRTQQGYLLLVAVMLIIIVGFLGSAIAYMFYGVSMATANAELSASAFYIAEGGLENATRLLLTSNLTGTNPRSACSGLSINTTFGAGAYAVTGTGPVNPSPTTLSGALTASATTIPVASTTGYQSSGRIMIDRELINYAAVDATNFIGVIRGVDGSIAASHASGTPVGQYVCVLSSQAGVPSLTPPSNSIGGLRVLSEAIQLQEGYIAGNTLSGPTTWNVAQWNIPTEKAWTQQTISIASPQILNGVSMISYDDIWVVGNKDVLLHSNGSTWTNINTGPAAGDNVLAVSGISSVEAWACTGPGDIWKWSGGASWTRSFNGSNPLNGISMVATSGSNTANTGWSVGNNKTAMLYNGTTWTSTNTGITVALNAVSTVSASDAWAAGQNGKIFHWNGSSWSVLTTPSATPPINGISMIQTAGVDLGWAVGNNVGASTTAWYYNGTAWTLTNTGLPASLVLNCVVTVSDHEAWVGTNNGKIYEWDGSTWNLVFTSSSAVAINGIDMIHPNAQPFSAWAETFA